MVSKESSAGKDVVKPHTEQSGTVPFQRAKPFQRFTTALELEQELSSGSGTSVAEQVVSKIVEADSLEAALAAQDSSIPSGKDMVDVPHIVQSFEVRKSDGQYSENGLGSYVVVTALNLDTQEEMQYATGAPNVVSILWKARELDRLPLEIELRSKPTQNGELLMVKLLPKRTI